MNVVKMSKSDKLSLPKKQTKGGRRNQKMFLRKAIAKKLKVPASSLKGKTFEELKEIYMKIEGVPGLSAEEEKQVRDVLSQMVDIVEQAEEPPFQPDFEEEELMSKITKARQEKRKGRKEIVKREIGSGIAIQKYPQTDLEEEEDVEEVLTTDLAPTEEMEDPVYNFSISSTSKKSGMRPEEPVEQKYESEKIDDDDRFSDNFFRGVNSYGSFIPNSIVPERRRYAGFSIREDIEEQNRTMRNDPDPLVEPPQNILEQNRILEGPDNVMPESEVEPQNPARVNYEMAIAANNIHSMEQNVQDRNAQRVRIAQRRILGEEADDDDVFGEDLEFEMKEELEEKYDPNLLVRDDETREQSILNNRSRLEKQIEEMSLAGQSRRNQTRGKQAHYQREAMLRLKAHDKMNQMNLDALRQKEIKWKRPTRTQAGNSVGLIRQSNRSMALLSHQLLP